ncbi:cation transporter [Bacillaceae bacterium Marseille-Q3522]|nr:cation transporter [Bacillaceae bacterium Marseille-Q3522]
MGIGHHHDGHAHTHGGVDGNIIKNDEATKVLLISFAGLLITAVFQAVIVAFTGSVALFADTIHNFGDALTSIPLWIAFHLSRRLPSKRFTYGLNRSEDIAGLFIVFVIFISAVVAGYESIRRLFEPVPMTYLGTTALAAIIGFIGNEIVALYRIRMGKRMGSAALVADGHHARIDGWTSLAVLIGVIGAWFGFPIVDPIIGLIITVMILFIVKDTAKIVLIRLMDGIEPEHVKNITASALKVEGVDNVNDVKARWFGHEIIAEVSIALAPDISIKKGHDVVKNVIHRMQHDVDHLSNVQVHVDPLDEQGKSFHTHEHFHEHHHDDHDDHDHHEHHGQHHDAHDHHHQDNNHEHHVHHGTN